MNYLTRPEEQVLIAAFRLKADSYIVKIRRYLNENSGRKWSMSSVYVTLKRLKKYGYMETIIGEPTSKRGGKAIKYYVITEKGIGALAELRKVNEVLWDGLQGLTPRK